MPTPRGPKRYRVGLGLDVIVEGATSKHQARAIAADEIARRVRETPDVVANVRVRLWDPADPDERPLRPASAVHDYSAHLLPAEGSV